MIEIKSEPEEEEATQGRGHQSPPLLPRGRGVGEVTLHAYHHLVDTFVHWGMKLQLENLVPVK